MTDRDRDRIREELKGQSDHDLLLTTAIETRATSERMDKVYKTLFGEDGRTGIVADVNQVKASHKWLCPAVILLAFVMVAIGGKEVVTWALKVL